MDFIDTEAGQFIAGAHKYLRSARIVVESETFRETPTVTFAPALHMIAHGAELLLKFPLLQSGRPLSEVVKFNHGLWALWEAPENHLIREMALDAAAAAMQAARASGRWQDDFNSTDASQHFLGHLRVLSTLHGQRPYPLRYISPPGTEAPRPRLMLDTLSPVAYALLGNPELATDERLHRGF